MSVEDKLAEKVTPVQAFRLMALTILCGFLLGAYGVYVNDNKDTLNDIYKSVTRTEMIREREIINLLNKQGAVTVYDKVFNTSRNEIIELMNKIITRNHINDVERRKDIRRIVERTVRLLYESDVTSLSLYTYKGKPLDIVMLDIDNITISNEILEYLFSNSREDHEFLKSEVTRMLKLKYSEFLSKANDYLKKIDKSTLKI